MFEKRSNNERTLMGEKILCDKKKPLSNNASRNNLNQFRKKNDLNILL